MRFASGGSHFGFLFVDRTAFIGSGAESVATWLLTRIKPLNPLLRIRPSLPRQMSQSSIVSDWHSREFWHGSDRLIAVCRFLRLRRVNRQIAGHTGATGLWRINFQAA